MKMNKRLYRSEKDKIAAGVCGGLAKYFDLDPAIVRLGWLLIVVFTGFIPGLIAYFVAIVIIPIEDAITDTPIQSASAV